MRKKIIVGISGASGSIYGIRLLGELVRHPVQVHLILSRAGQTIVAHETDFDPGAPMEYFRVKNIPIHADADIAIHSEDDFFAPPASGSFRHDGMVIAPCSMKTLGMIAAGIAETLIHRAADVCLKEKRPLILLPRETPLSLIHLENMCRVARAGAIMMPAAPSFYSHPQSMEALIDTVVARVLDHLGFHHSLIRPWGT